MTNQINRFVRRLNIFGTCAGAMLVLTLVAGCYAPPEERGAVRVIHALQVPFAAAAAVDANGTTLGTETFHCAPNQACSLFLPRDVLAQTAALRFLDAQGRLVGAYPKGNLANIGYTVTADADMMGVELFNRLVAQGTYTPATLIHLADEHLYREYPAGDRPSFFADLQAHYQRRLADPTYNEQKYLDDVLKTIAERNGGQISAVTTGPAAQGVVLKSNTVTPACDPTWKNINTIVGFSAKLSGVTGATMIEGLSNIIGGTCTSSGFTEALKDIMSTLSKVQDQLNGIDTKLTALGVNLNQLAADAAFRDFQTRYDAFSSKLTTLKEVITTYKAVLSPTSSGYKPPRYANLSGYIDALGGLSKDTYDENKALNKLLGDLPKNVNVYYDAVSLIKASDMIADLYTLCRTSSTIVGDVIGRRDACTMWAMRAINEASAVASALRIVVSDAFTVISNASAGAASDTSQTNWLNGTFTNDLYPGVLSWDTTKNQVLNDMWSKLDLFVGEMSKAVFDDTALGTTLASVPPKETPPDGLAPTLLNNIKLAGCSKSFQGKSFAAIESWVVQAAQPSPYVTTRCVGRNDELVYSRFHYTTDVGPNNTVLNMLGVLIKPEKVVESWNGTYYCCAGEMIGGEDSGFYQERVCLDGGDGRCDWWMVAPGVYRTVVKTMSDGVVKETTVRFNQVRSHTSVVSDTKQQRVPVNETFLYNPPINDRILHPVTKPMGRDVGYQQDTSSDTLPPPQYFWGSRWTVSPQSGPGRYQDYQDGYLTYTWVANKQAWEAVPDRRYTRTVAMKVGQIRMYNSGMASWWTYVDFKCITSDCNQPVANTRQESSTFIYTEGPRIQWNFFMDDWGRWHMFVDGKSSDGRDFPERR